MRLKCKNPIRVWVHVIKTTFAINLVITTSSFASFFDKLRLLSLKGSMLKMLKIGSISLLLALLFWSNHLVLYLETKWTKITLIHAIFVFNFKLSSMTGHT